MKMQGFTSIKQFFNFKTKCIFCNNPLDLLLTNWDNTNIINNIINSPLKVKNDKIEFMFTHRTYKCSYQSKAFIDINKNSLDLLSIKSIATIEKAIIIINNYQMQLELQCNNSKCKTVYYIKSTPLKFFISENENENESANILLYPFHLMLESFIINDKNLRIENDFYNNKLSIDTIKKHYLLNTSLNFINDKKKIIIPKAINFDNLSEEAILSKIDTIILYS